MMSFVPLGLLPGVLQAIYPFLGTDQALFFWAVASLGVLPFMKDAKRRSPSMD